MDEVDDDSAKVKILAFNNNLLSSSIMKFINYFEDCIDERYSRCVTIPLTNHLFFAFRDIIRMI